MNIIRRYSSGGVHQKFKNSMACVSSQAMILTAGFKGPATSSLHGMTLSSVCSLSVYPNPLLQFNLHLPSYTSKTLHENDGVVAIHLLSATPAASKLGRIFASGIKKDNGIKSKGEENDGEIFHEMATPFNNIPKHSWEYFNLTQYKIPILKESERIFICCKKNVIEIDNHEIWVVEVQEILENTSHHTGGLLYYNRAFHRTGEVIDEQI